MTSAKTFSAKSPTDVGATATRALVIGPYRDERSHASGAKPSFGPDPLSVRSHESRIAEAKGLAGAIDLDVVDARIVSEQDQPESKE